MISIKDAVKEALRYKDPLKVNINDTGIQLDLESLLNNQTVKKQCVEAPKTFSDSEPMTKNKHRTG